MPLSGSNISVSQVGPASFEYNWDTTASATFDVILNGTILRRSDEEREDNHRYLVYSTDTQEPPALEVINADSEDLYDSQQGKHPPYALLQWRGNSDAAAYRIERLDSTWTHIALIVESGRGYYQHQTGAINDVTTHQYRVIPRDGNGVEGNDLDYNLFMVRNPSPPSISISYSSSGGTITVSSR